MKVKSGLASIFFLPVPRLKIAPPPPISIRVRVECQVNSGLETVIMRWIRVLRGEVINTHTQDDGEVVVQ